MDSDTVRLWLRFPPKGMFQRCSSGGCPGGAISVVRNRVFVRYGLSGSPLDSESLGSLLQRVFQLGKLRFGECRVLTEPVDLLDKVSDLFLDVVAHGTFPQMESYVCRNFLGRP